jgi:methyl-accepting chemotaxis protein
MFKSLRIGPRLFIGFGLILALLLVTALVSFRGISQVGTGVDGVLDQNQKMTLARDVQALFHEVVQDVGTTLLSDDPRVQADLAERIKADRAAYKPRIEALRASMQTPTGRRMVDDLQSIAGEIRDVDNQVLELARTGHGAEARKLYAGKVQEGLGRLDAAHAAFGAWREKRMDLASTTIRSDIFQVKAILVTASILALLVSAFLSLALTRGITGPLQLSVDRLQTMGEGDLHEDLSREALARKDEVGDIARSMQKMVLGMRNAIQDVTTGSQDISQSSRELRSLSTRMAVSAQSTSDKASTVAAAAEEMSVSSSSIAAGMEQTTATLGSISDSMSQMTSTIVEIAGKSELARSITGEAVARAEGMGALMAELGTAAHQIGKVTETITLISSQTNLLALNATIEAARAGAAGKGFAVVASEIKELAQQTAAATEDIKARISAIQESASGATENIQGIGQVIRDVSDIVSTIATAIEEQSMVTRDIAGNLSQASDGIRDGNHRVAQGSMVAQTIAQDITGVDQAAQDITSGIEQVRASAVELAMLSERLNQTLEHFRT